MVNSHNKVFQNNHIFKTFKKLKKIFNNLVYSGQVTLVSKPHFLEGGVPKMKPTR